MTGFAVLRCNDQLPYLILKGTFGKGQNKKTFRIKLSLRPKTANVILNNSALGEGPGAEQAFNITDTKDGTRLTWQDSKQQFALQGFLWDAAANAHRQNVNAEPQLISGPNKISLFSAQVPIAKPAIRVVPSQIQPYEDLVGTRGRQIVQAGSSSRQISRSPSANGKVGMAGQFGPVRIGIVQWGRTVDVKPNELYLSGGAGTVAGCNLFFYSGPSNDAKYKTPIVLDPHVAHELPSRLPEQSIAILETDPSGNIGRLQWIRRTPNGRIRYTTDFMPKSLSDSGFYTQLIKFERS
jgi:hypothetical protein